MEKVLFLTAESDEDLIVAFALETAEAHNVRSVSLIRSPSFEHVLPEAKRGVGVYDEARDGDDNDLLAEVLVDGTQVKIVSSRTEFQLDCSAVEPEEFVEAKEVLQKMHFDERFRLMIR